MKDFRFCYVMLYLFFFNCSTGKAQGIIFNHLTANEGLSHYSVMAIYQDERGLMWFGTKNGISVYNGNSIRIYKHEKDNPNSLTNNSIEQIVGDQNGTIYINTISGVSAYNIREDKFTTILNRPAVSMFFKTHLYIAEANQIFRYNGHKFEPFYQLPDKRCKISAIHIDNDSLYIGTSNAGLYAFANNKLEHIIPKGNISDIFKDHAGHYWVTNSRDGVGLYLIQNGTIHNFKSIEGNEATISSNFTQRACEDQQGNVWIGTFNGLTKYDRRQGQFVRHPRKGQPNMPTHSSIWSLYCDKQNTIWAGTYFGGVNYFNPEKQVYDEYRQSSKEGYGLSSGIISRMIEDKNNNLWICTEGGGLNTYNRKTNTFQWYKSNKGQNSISHNNVKSIYYDAKQDIMWLGTHMGGLNKLDIRSGHFTHYKHDTQDPMSIPSDIIMDIIPYKNSLLLATKNGIAVFNPQNGKCKLLLQNEGDLLATNETIGLLIDHQGILWITNDKNGACAYNFETQTLKVYKYNPSIKDGFNSNNINSIFEDSQHRLWFCTNDNGLMLYNQANEKFEKFNMQHNGLPSSMIYNIIEIDANRLLMTTDKGLSFLDLPSKKCSNYLNLPLALLKENALYQTKDHDIFVGGIDGMISFNKKDVQQRSRQYDIFPNRLIVNDKEVFVGDESGILSQSLSAIEHITLGPDQSVFSIEYANTDYIPFGEDDIFYRLEGFSDSWASLNKQHTITYTNLSPSTYTLVVQARDKTSQLVTENRIKIKVLPPFYRSTTAYLLYIVCLAALAYYLIKTYKQRIKLQESLKYEKKHVENIESMNLAKLRFFTNISHEFRTPLTLIIGQTEMLLQLRSFSPTVYNQILGVYKNCLQLRELIDELLDFRKQEQGYMTIKVQQHNIVDFVHMYYLLFQEHAIQRNINFKFEKTHDDIQIWYDTKQMQKVINNIISNALKYTQEGGQIVISVRNRIEEVLIEVTDNGIGISPENIEKIFDRFYQTEQLDFLPSASGTGIGLALTKGIVELHHGRIEVLSRPKEGTTFCIYLKAGTAHFRPDQISDTSEETIVKLDIARLELELQQPLVRDQEIRDNDNLLKQRRYKLLIVEDNQSLGEMLFKIFDPFYNVITASDGAEGLEKVKAEQPDMVLSDVIMSKMSGIELCRAIKNDIELCHIPVVLLTAETAAEHTIEGLKTGADDYISKPFNINILLSRCNNLINNRIMLQERFGTHTKADPKMLATNNIDKIFIDKVMEVIEKHLDNVEFNVNMLAGEMGIARTKLFTKMKAITGQSPLDFIMTIRLKRGAYMLRHHLELNISEIADRIGFNSPKYFTKCFKEMYHIAPQAFRKGDGISL
ncbi:hybrid sensor histidine kinase/response regulator transcription factor [Sphingobacterium lumbrici]|uniref:hybrid sensor histidine kinase/response regulator transcription factor n=1 Tax=Sphingobacterium lumbrici TaxID=2559600 RepID=UPI001128F94A|nr:hybrid sensor histidine kinase/response regulator transcription factor [Sphingobacterium lumbrici]